MDLFEYKASKNKAKEAPLADRMRPETFDEFVGQTAVVGEGSALRKLIEADEVPSLIFWGPPGTGKTTLARLIATQTESRFVALSATSAGVAELRVTVAEAKERLNTTGTHTIVFVDEIHRWNKAQQDAFLPFVEDGTVTLIGATTENPSFEVNSALLSRSRVFVLSKLEPEQIAMLLRRAVDDPKRGFGGRVVADDEALRLIADVADGDARSALNALELAANAALGGAKAGVRAPKAGDKSAAAAPQKMVHLQKADVAKVLTRSHFLYDKSGEEHYNIISALHKSMRGSDADAALYWMGRMLESGDDPLYVARRVVRFAAEDVGLADPNAMLQAVAAFQASHQLGMPECELHLAQAVVYCACAPKSNDLYRAYGEVKRTIAESPNDPVPVHLRNAPTKLMKDLGYGRDYIYTHDDPTAHQEFMPARLRKKKFLRAK